MKHMESKGLRASTAWLERGIMPVLVIPVMVGSAACSSSGASPPRASATLKVDASDAFGYCTAPDVPSFCGGAAHSQPDPNFVAGRGSIWPRGTTTTGICWTTGGTVNAPATNLSSTRWIKTTLSATDPWMNALYFSAGSVLSVKRHC